MIQSILADNEVHPHDVRGPESAHGKGNGLNQDLWRCENEKTIASVNSCVDDVEESAYLSTCPSLPPCILQKTKLW